MAEPVYSLGIISKRPELLKKNLPLYVRKMPEPRRWRIILRDGDTEHEDNGGFLKRLAMETGVRFSHLSDGGSAELARELGLALGRRADALFSEGYGGLRNSVALLAALHGTHLVFIDDDTSPLYNFIERYERLFAEGRGLIPGGYEGHISVSSPALLYDLSHVLSLAAGGEMAAEDASSAAARIMRGVPFKRESYSLNMVAGGNLGISLALLRQVPFCPTKRRVEDALFFMTVAALRPDAVYRPSDYREAYDRLPLVEHERVPSERPCLLSQLLDEMRGAVLAGVIGEMDMASFVKETNITEKDLEVALAAAVERTWKDFGVELFRKNITENARFLGEQERAELDGINALGKDDITVGLEELKEQLNLFSFALRTWPYVTAAVEEEEVRKRILKVVG